MTDETQEEREAREALVRPKVVSILGSGAPLPDPAKPNEGLVQLLEHLLLDVKSGRVRSAAFVAVDAQGQVLTQWNSEHTLLLIAGMAELLKHNLFMSVFSAARGGK